MWIYDERDVFGRILNIQQDLIDDHINYEIVNLPKPLSYQKTLFSFTNNKHLAFHTQRHWKNNKRKAKKRT